jgi:hypothetical protein
MKCLNGQVDCEIMVLDYGLYRAGLEGLETSIKRG